MAAGFLRVAQSPKMNRAVGYRSTTTAAFAVLAAAWDQSTLSKKQELKRVVDLTGIRNKEEYMFIILFAVLLLAWLGGFLVFHVSSALIHVLLLLAVLSLIAHLFQRRTVS